MRHTLWCLSPFSLLFYPLVPCINPNPVTRTVIWPTTPPSGQRRGKHVHPPLSTFNFSFIVFVSVVTHCWTVFSGTPDLRYSLLTENSQLVFRSQHCNEKRAPGLTHIHYWTHWDVHGCQESRLNAVLCSVALCDVLLLLIAVKKKTTTTCYCCPSVGFFCIILRALLPPSVTQRNYTQSVLSCNSVLSTKSSCAEEYK